MYYISNYRKKAIEKIIPYLIEFPQIVSIVENSADRYQAIEDVIWRIANNFKVDDARGVFLQALAHNEVTDIIYTDKAKDAFTYGTDEPLYQAYGTGHYYSQSSYISGIKKDLTDEKTIRAVKSKIIQNNTNCSIEDLIECLKLNYNAEHIKIYESNPLNLSLMLVGKNLEISSSDNKEIIKRMLPACVALNNIYVDSYSFDVFKYDENTSYGDHRYPVLVNETTDVYRYISQSVTLSSQFKEYILTNHDGFDINNYCCIAGAFSSITPNSTIFSISDTENSKQLSFKISENNKFALFYNGVISETEIEPKLNVRYNFIIANHKNTIKLFIIESMNVYGKSLNQDISFIRNRILSSTPTLSIESFENINSKICINAENSTDGFTNFNDFTYYAIIFGDITNEKLEPTEYYVSCYGEKQILFNCFENKNHLYIQTTNPLISNIMTNQSYYNYKDSHSNGKYIYMDGKSGINYNFSDGISNCEIDNIDISFDVCMPIELSQGNIITDFVSNQDSTSRVYFDKDGKLYIEFPLTILTEEGGEEGTETLIEKDIIGIYSTDEKVIDIGEYSNFRITVSNNQVSFYKNNKNISSAEFDGTIKNIPSILRIAYDKEITNPYKGFIKNVIVKVSATSDTPESINIELNLPLKSSLKDKTQKIEYINYGARFITTPQLINNQTKKDIYNNELIGIR